MKLLQVLSLREVCGDDCLRLCEECVGGWEAEHENVRRKGWAALFDVFRLKGRFMSKVGCRVLRLILESIVCWVYLLALGTLGCETRIGGHGVLNEAWHVTTTR